MNLTPIDLWNLDTFDEVLLSKLGEWRDLLRNYDVTRKINLLEQQTSEVYMPLKSNTYANQQNYVVEQVIMPAMAERTIRAWHYTRLTDREVALIESSGIYISDLGAIRQRLDAQVAARLLSAGTADALYAASPFHQQNMPRSGKFWMTSHPVSVDDRGVELLLAHWGGEGVYFWLQDPALIELVKSLGRPRVIEIAVPLLFTRQVYSAATAVVATYLKVLGCHPEHSAFDLYTTNSLAPDAVLNIHTEGDPKFADLARGYPAGFVDRDQ